MPRVKIAEFGIIQKTLAGAIVAFYVADSNGKKTPVRATLYQADTGTDQYPNPQTLTVNGQLPYDCYVETVIMAEISNISDITERQLKKIKINPLQYPLPVTSSNIASSGIAGDADAAEQAAQTAVESKDIVVALETTVEGYKDQVVTLATNAATSEGNAASSASTASTAAADALSYVNSIIAVFKALVYEFKYDNSLSMADPGAGDVRFNNTTLASITAAAISINTGEPIPRDVSKLLKGLGTSTSAEKGEIFFIDKANTANYAHFYVTATVADNTSWLQLTLEWVASAGNFTTTTDIFVSCSKFGNDGIDGAGTATYGIENISTLPTVAPVGSDLVGLNDVSNSNAVFKATITALVTAGLAAGVAIGGNTSVTGTFSTTGNTTISGKTIPAGGYNQEADAAPATGTVTLNMTAGNYRKITPSGDFTLEVTPPTGAVGFYVANIIAPMNHDIVWQGVDIWLTSNGLAPTLKLSGNYRIGFIADSAGVVTAYVIGREIV